MSDTYERRKRHGRSLFGPIFLIAVGALFLLNNLGMMPSTNWTAVFQLWPLWLIFLGINLIVQQAPRPLGSFLSGLVGITAVATFGYILFASVDSPLLSRFNIAAVGEKVTEAISFAPDDVDSAQIMLDMGAVGADVYALTDSRDLIAGQVTYAGELVFDTDAGGGEATVSLDTRSGNRGWFSFDNISFDEADRWQIGLSPDVLTALTIDGGVGTLSLRLAGLQLSDLDVDMGAGDMNLTLPQGAYAVTFDGGAGSTEIVFPTNGRLSVDLDGGVGNFLLLIPSTMPTRIEVNSGVGSFDADGRFEKISNDDEDGVWQTADYSGSNNQLDILVDVGVGNVTVQQPNGR